MPVKAPFICVWRATFSTGRDCIARSWAFAQVHTYGCKCRRRISPSLIFRWRRLMAEGGKEAVKAYVKVVGGAEVRALRSSRERSSPIGTVEHSLRAMSRTRTLPKPVRCSTTTRCSRRTVIAPVLILSLRNESTLSGPNDAPVGR